MEFFCTVPRPHFFGQALIWPGCFGEHILGHVCLDYILRVCQNLWDSFFLSGKASLVSISAAILFLRFWHVYFVKKVVLNERACRRKWHLVPPTLYIIIVYRVNLNKLLQIITKLRWSNKDNNN